MKIINTKSYDNTVKKLNRHIKEKDNLRIIGELIENNENFESLVSNPISAMYGFERLKHSNNCFYSFNLCKNGGKIRLIVYPNDNDTSYIYLVFVSFKHYQDFSKEKVIYYDE